jgi:hypothetical protein
MTTDEAQAKGFKLLLEQTVQRGKAYPKTITDPELHHRVQVALDRLADLAGGIELAIKEYQQRQAQ